MPLNVISTSARIAVYQSVSRARTDSNMSVARGVGVAGEHVSGAADGADQLLRRDLLDVTSEPVDVDLDHVRERIELLVPHVLRELFASDDALGVAGEVFENRVLLRRQHKRPLVD